MIPESSKSNVEILYMGKKICEIPYDPKSTVKDIKTFLSMNYNLKHGEIMLAYDKLQLMDDNVILSSFLLTNLGKISGDMGKVRVRVVPQIQLCQVKYTYNFIQMENESNVFPFTFDVISTTMKTFKESVFSFFKEKLDEFNYKISGCEFYDNCEAENLLFGKIDDNECICKCPCENSTFFFLIKNSSVNFYTTIIKPSEPLHNNSSQFSAFISCNENEISLRKNVSSGEKFKIVIQTYNQVIKELEVYPEMPIGVLKDKIEELFQVRKDYQELLYLVYRLNDKDKLIKDYYIRPYGVIFLRGFYYPIIFADFYKKSNKSIVAINIAEQISQIKTEVISRMKLDMGGRYKLLFNGKELDEKLYLIDYNIQKMQMIYIK